MIKVLVYDSGKGPDRGISLSVSGHGESKVCTRVSILTEMVSAYLYNLAACKPDILGVQVSQGNGVLLMDAIVRQEDKETHNELDAIVWTLTGGLESIDKMDSSEFGYIALFAMPFLFGKPIGPSHEDYKAYVRAWRTENKVIVTNLHPFDPLPA